MHEAVVGGGTRQDVVGLRRVSLRQTRPNMRVLSVSVHP
jgi:hypothetical protein